MNKLASRIKPAGGFSQVAHLGLTLLLPILLYVMVRIDFVQLAAALIILSKWRMFAVRMRYWPANIRANAVDIVVGLSVVVFMSSTTVSLWQIVWAAAYALWLVFLKPGSSVFLISLQAMVAQLSSLMAVFLIWGHTPLYVLVFTTWLICYLCARHFFTSFDEQYTSMYAHVWGYFAAAMVWVLGHWLLFYGVLAQPTLLLIVIGYGLASMYYLDHADRLTAGQRRNFIFMAIAIIAIVLTFSDWGDRAV